MTNTNNRFFGFGIIFTILALLVSSWILVHILTLFGIFLGIAYPLWWMFAPRQTACFLCRSQKEGSTCAFCRKPIIKSEGISPKSLGSAILNGCLVLVFSVVSIGLVYGESLILNRMGYPETPQTASFIIPPTGQFRVGEIFPMKLEIQNIGNSINTVQADIGFDPAHLEVVDISTTESFANVFVQKEINNEGGWARLTGGLPNPGFHEPRGTFGTVYFRAKLPGLTRIEFLSTSMVLANDGKGTNILKDFPNVSYVILPERISGEEEKMQQQIIFSPDVLGETSSSNQLLFFEDTKILGTDIAQESEEVKELDLNHLFLNTLGKTNTRILDFWKELLSNN